MKHWIKLERGRGPHPGTGFGWLALLLGFLTGIAGAAEPEKLWELKLSRGAADADTRTDDRISIGPDGTIYVASLGGTLTSITPAGKANWEVKVGQLYTSVPIGNDGTIIFATLGGQLLAYGTNGQMRWEFPLRRSNPGSPGVALDGTIYAAGLELFAINPDGTKKWSYAPEGTTLSRISCAQGPEGTIFVTASDQTIHAVNPDGTHRWAMAIDGSSGTTLEVSREGVLHLITNRKLYAVRPDGTIKWELAFEESAGSLARVADDGTVYLVAGQNLVAVAAAGTRKWSYDLEGRPSKIPLFGHDGVVYAGTMEGKIHAVNPDGARRWVFEAGSAMAANLAQSVEGALYFEAKSVLYALNTGKPVKPGQAARFRRDDNFHPERFRQLAKPEPPGALAAAKAESLTGVQLRWESAANASGYEIWRAERNDEAAAVLLVKNLAGTTNYEDRTVSEGITYYYWMKAVNFSGASGFSKSDSGSVRGKLPGDIIWMINAEAPIHSTPALAADGVVYFGTRGQKLLAVSPEGKIRWKYNTDGDIDSSPVVGADGAIFVGSHDRKLHAIKPDGTKKWEFVTGGFISSSPALAADGTVYIGSWDKKIYAVKSDGAKRWEFSLPDSIVATPTIAPDGTLYVGCDDGKLYAFTPDGAKKWEFATGGPLHSAPAVGPNGTLYFGSPDCSLYAVASDGRKQWTFTTKQPIYSSPAIGADGVIYFAGGDCKLYAMNPDGAKRWDYDASAVPAPALALGAEGAIYLGYSDGRLLVMDRDGKLKWSFASAAAVVGSPVLGARGTIYFGTTKGNFYAIKGAAEAGDYFWPMYRRDARRAAAATDKK